eukprot:TRINITY_DN15869_c0_g1_i1.p1 TRINITY_DN15869_c0_g1~~TRINITY_DN15869_c0_g1_i1.p1  ORF type:complete len:198 (+),score=64.27 TRINITY_DN15869_c0_g1_i1:55-594(+)
MGFEEEREAAMAMVWGDGNATGKSSKTKQKRKKDDTKADDESELSEPEEKKLTANAKRKKANAENVRERTLHIHIDNTADRNDVRTLFEDYDPKVVIEKYKNIKRSGKYALVEFKTRAMAEHARQRFDGTDQKETLGVEKVSMTFCLSRRASRRQQTKANKVKKAIIKSNYEQSKLKQG